jgi:hypothetical protein
VRDFTRLERFSDDDLLKSAAILSETYRSDDPAFHFLRKYDRRRGTQTSASFAEYVTANGLEIMFMTFRP